MREYLAWEIDLVNQIARDADCRFRLAPVGGSHTESMLGSMIVRVRLFAGLRERAGWAQREVDVSSVAEVWPALDLGDEPNGLLYAVNKEYATRDHALADGDEVALIPPVSGGAFLLSVRKGKRSSQ